uniref:Insulin-like growth factor-binding protein 7 isoform X2 n=1 Tax=Geotrypetes seraphini TaxID=260995 RepID=A0A6P8N6E1_GEOSA|nr:insulin-like growth factor-binding protein 7 isoform X2 [Geotrypetes seraphini]
MKRLSSLLLLLPSLFWVSGWAAKDPRPRVCGQCLRAQCAPLPAEGCKLGAVLDSCGCCALCAAGEGEACAARGARCAAGSECLRSGGSSACVCKSRQPVCGSDGVTYPSSCALRAANLRGKSGVRQFSKGPCKRAPSIVTPPKDVWNISGAQIYLSCEVIGIPTPILTWNKRAPLTILGPLIRPWLQASYQAPLISTDRQEIFADRRLKNTALDRLSHCPHASGHSF